MLHHPQGYGLGNAGTTAQRFDVKLKAGESNYTELGAETGLAGALLFIAWSLALFVGLLRTAWQGDLFAAGVAAALAATLALAVQTDVVGVPWLAYCLWWLAGALSFHSSERCRDGRRNHPARADVVGGWPARTRAKPKARRSRSSGRPCCSASHPE